MANIEQTKWTSGNTVTNVHESLGKLKGSTQAQFSYYAAKKFEPSKGREQLGAKIYEFVASPVLTTKI